MKLLANVTAYGGAIALVTITAPGRDVLPQTSGRVHSTERWRWNRDAPARWRRLHREAAQIARRRHGRFSLVASTWEYQRRGVLHRHVLVGVETPTEAAAAETYARALHELRGKHGFGFVDRGRRTDGKRSLPRVPADRAARYVAKYLSPLGDDSKPTMSRTVTEPDVPPHVTYVSRRLTMATGVTMRSLRERRRDHVLAQLARTSAGTNERPAEDDAGGDPPPTASGLDPPALP